MLAQKYHAILFICILVMLLLLGLHLLGIGYSSGQATAKSAALARNSSQTASSSNVNTAQAYRHPIIYDKLTGATNNQINDVLGSGKAPLAGDYPIDHYQQQQSSQQQQQQQFNQLPQDDFFNSIHRQGGGFPPLNHPAHHMHLPLGPPGMQLPPPLMTTQTPTLRPQPPLPPPPSPPRQLQIGPLLPPMAPPPPPPQRADSAPASSPASSAAQASDSVPSASSLNNNNQSRQQQSSAPNNNNNNNTNQRLTPAHLRQGQPIYGQQPQQPAYYTPPIFAYNNFDQNRPLVDPQLGIPFGFPNQQQPPLGVPEAPLSIDEYNARQARLRQMQQQQQQQQQPNEVPQIDRYTKPPVRSSAAPLEAAQQYSSGQQPNLLADSQQQQLHKQQMLDPNQLLFGAYNTPDINNNNNQSYYPDPAIGYRPLANPPPPQNPIRPPYAHNMSPSGELMDQLGGGRAGPPQAAQSRLNPPISNRLESGQPAKLISSTERPPKAQPPAGTGPAGQSGLLQVAAPLCARQQVNESSLNSSATTQLPIMLCNEDPEYPTKEIMRALENYANERSVEQLLPQPLVQIHLAAQRSPAQETGGARQLALDSLQASIGGPLAKDSLTAEQQPPPPLFPSANFESMCRSNVYMAQPRRAKNLLGQWKVVVNLPGHKYRGIAISQMLRLEECSRPNGECTGPIAAPPGPQANARGPAPPVLGPMARSRCLQQYENQRLVAWSHQQGLHVDIFRVPIACSCHIRR